MLARDVVAALRRHAVDAGVALVLFVAALIGGQAYVDTLVSAGQQGQFYQYEFGPAVMMACGRGYVNPVHESVPALKAFITQQVDRFDCGSLPDPAQTMPLSGSQATWKYLLWTAAATWRVQGAITWTGLQKLSGVLLALTAVCGYFALRIAAGPALSAAGAALVASSPMHLRYLADLRDYAKAPFMIVLVACLVIIVTRPMPARSLIKWSLAFGAILGLGIGFRNDLLIMGPAFLVAVAFAGWRRRERRLLAVGAGMGAAAAGFLIMAAPLLSAYGRGGGAGMPHVALLGFAPAFDRTLGIERSPLYGFSHGYDDSAAAAVISDVAYRRLHATQPIQPYDAAYDTAGNTLVLSVFRLLPGDVWIRGLAGTLKILGLPGSSAEDTEPPPALTHPTAARVYDLRARLVRGRQGLMLALVVAAFAIGGAVAPAETCVLLLLTCYFAAYPAVQFHERHFLQLNILPMAALVFVARSLAGVVRRRRGRRDMARPDGRRAAVGIAAVGGLAVAVLLVPLAILRLYQDATLRAAFEHYLVMPREVMPPQETAADGAVSLEYPNLPARARSAEHPQTVQTEYLSLEVGGSQCETVLVRVRLDYDNATGTQVFGRSLALQPPRAGSMRVFFPVYYFVGAPFRSNPPIHFAFKGLTIPEAERGCIREVSRVRETGELPLLLDLSLPPGWPEATRHQVLEGWEQHRRVEPFRLFVSSESRPVHASDVEGPLALLDPASVAERADPFSMPAPGRVEVGGAGGGAGRFMYLATFTPEAMPAGRRLIAEGVLRRGGFSIGVIADGRWVVNLPVTAVGRFVAVLDVPADLPSASLVVANNLPAWALRNDFEISRIGWLTP